MRFGEASGGEYATRTRVAAIRLIPVGCLLSLVCGCQGDPVGEVKNHGGGGSDAGFGGVGGLGGEAGIGGAAGSGGTAGNAGQGGASGGGACPSPCFLVSGSLGGASDVAVAGSYVYFLRNKSVLRVPKLGGQPELMGAVQSKARALAVAGGHVFVLDGKKSIRRLNLNGGGIKLLAQGIDFETFDGLAANASHVYWTRTKDTVSLLGAVLRVPHQGGSIETIAGNQNAAAPHGLALDASSVFWVNSNSAQIYKAPLAGGTPTLIQNQVIDKPWNVAVNSKYVFWTELSGGLAFQKHGEKILPPKRIPGNGADALVVDEKQAYWAASQKSQLLAAGVGSTSATIFFDGIQQPLGLDQDQNFVYAASGQGKPAAIIKLAK